MAKDLKKVVEALDTPTTPSPRRKWNWREPNISLATFLGLALVAALMIVGVGHLLYINSSEYKLDITRPGFKDIKNEELVEVDRAKSYDSTSPVDRAALQAEIKSLTTRQQDLDRYGDFTDKEINDAEEALFNPSNTTDTVQ